MKGWECPKCARCYAPHVKECLEHRTMNFYEKLKDIPGEIHIYGTDNYGECLVCRGLLSKELGEVADVMIKKRGI